MKESQSVTNSLLIEVDILSNRLKNIKLSFKTTNNKALKERLFLENKNIFKRVNEIYKIAEILNKKNNDKINFSKLLVEISKRILNENKFESNLFFLSVNCITIFSELIRSFFQLSISFSIVFILSFLLIDSFLID